MARGPGSEREGTPSGRTAAVATVVESQPHRAGILVPVALITLSTGQEFTVEDPNRDVANRIREARQEGDRAMSDQQPPKPSLFLLPGHGIGLAEILDLFRHLTGREPTPEEVEEAHRELEKEGEAELLGLAADGPLDPAHRELEKEGEAEGQEGG